MTLCVTFDALIKAASESHDNYERLNNGDGVSDSRQAAGGTKEGTEMAGEQQRSRTSWSGFTDDHIFGILCIIYVNKKH